MEIDKIVARNLSFLRKKANLTQQELAKAINYSDNAVSRWERGEVIPSLETLQIIANFYSIEISDLLKEEFIYKDESSSSWTVVKRVFVVLLSIMVVWMFVIITYIYLQNFANRNDWLIFVAAIPLSALIGLYFNKMWGPRVINTIAWSIFYWSLISTIYLGAYIYKNMNIWSLFLLGVPIQFAIILWYFIKRPIKNK